MPAAADMKLPAGIWRHPLHVLALGFGAGAVPVAPGTFGTLAAIPLYLLMTRLDLTYYIAAVVLLFGIGVWACDKTGRQLGIHDHPAIVWDEVVGYLITMIAVPLSWYWLLAGFLLFRLFDIWKPFPIRLLDQRVGGGFGVMVDDLVAGVYAWLTLWGLILGWRALA